MKLLINKNKKTELNQTSFGGLPVQNIDEEFQWPSCKSCKLPMQHLGRIELNGDLLQLFMCQNNPGMCDDWDSNAGGNAVIVTTPKHLQVVSEPNDGVTNRETEYSAEIVEVEEEDYDEARSNWAEKNTVSPREVLGQIGGNPAWLQNDETPNCEQCGKPMSFVAQLETGPDWKTEMNFGGGGVGYLFNCDCKGSAKFLWQC